MGSKNHYGEEKKIHTIFKVEIKNVKDVSHLSKSALGSIPIMQKDKSFSSAGGGIRNLAGEASEKIRHLNQQRVSPSGGGVGI